MNDYWLTQLPKVTTNWQNEIPRLNKFWLQSHLVASPHSPLKSTMLLFGCRFPSSNVVRRWSLSPMKLLESKFTRSWGFGRKLTRCCLLKLREERLNLLMSCIVLGERLNAHRLNGNLQDHHHHHLSAGIAGGLISSELLRWLVDLILHVHYIGKRYQLWPYWFPI